MTTIALIFATAVLLYLGQEYRYGAHVAKLLAAQATERETAAKTIEMARASFDAQHAALLAAFAAEREQSAIERGQLLNRIKPETAQPILYTEVVAPPAVPMDDDQAFHESREELAERLGRLETGVMS